MGTVHERKGATRMSHGRHTRLLRLALLTAGTWLLPGTALADGTPLAIQQKACSFASMLEDVRAGLKAGSPAYQRYMKLILKEAALAMPADELVAAVNAERDPDVLEALGAALATKAGNEDSPSLLQPLLTRATQDTDPKLRAAAVRGMRGSASVDLMARNDNVVTYEHLVRDPAPEVREAAAENLVHESGKVYFGHDKAVSETAVAAAVATRDPEVAARLLSDVSMEQVGPEAVQRLGTQLRSESPRLRAAAATALGGVPGPEAAGAQRSLVDLYRGEKDASVRKAALEGIARLGQADARPVLESLRGIDPALDAEINAWLSALELNLQEWRLVQREQQRRRK